MTDYLCKISDFTLSFQEGKKWYPAVSGLNLSIKEGEMTALVGESGCGKTMTALSLIGLAPETARISGSLLFEGKELTRLKEKEWETVRGNEISMIFQEPMTALNPLIKVGRQIGESLTAKKDLPKDEVRKRVIEMMKKVGLPDAEGMCGAYPHQLSGGQRQRIMIAMAFMNRPKLLIADEPTTALDVTIQTQILELMKQMCRENGTAVLFISHDLGIVKNLCSSVHIMYAGHLAESGRTEEVLKKPLHPYTKGLLAAMPSADLRGRDLATIPGTVPPLAARNSRGCVFAGRCPYAEDRCLAENPVMKERNGHTYACLRENSSALPEGIRNR